MVLIGSDAPVFLVNPAGTLCVVHGVIAIEVASPCEGGRGGVHRMWSFWWHDATKSITLVQWLKSEMNTYRRLPGSITTRCISTYASKGSGVLKSSGTDPRASSTSILSDLNILSNAVFCSSSDPWAYSSFNVNRSQNLCPQIFRTHVCWPAVSLVVEWAMPGSTIPSVLWCW